MVTPNTNESSQSITRVRIWYGLLLLIIGIFGLRLFYVQIINHGHYRAAALHGQLKQYEIPATRGIIKAHNGDSVLPIVLNEKLYVLYADPVYVKDPVRAADKVAAAIGGDRARYERLMQTKKSRYVVLAKKLTNEQQAKITALKLPGVGTQAQNYRTYPQNSLAAQTLGFVNDEGVGKYGVEQALDQQLKGKPGELRAITDANGTPLAASKDNTRTAPQNGKDVTLTLDIAMQQQVENLLAKGVKNTKASGASAIVMDPNTGAVKAMANVPTYNPSRYFDVDDPSVFQNDAVSEAIEVGSTMKTLTTAAALDQGVIRANTTFHDPSFWIIDDFRITNIEEDGGPGTRSIAQLLDLSLNTGATWELMQMGGGQLNAKARTAWHNYMANHYMFGKPTGIEQGYENAGIVPRPEDNGAGINLTYANTSFGQAMTATPVQMAAALSAVLNGGTYYQPRVVDGQPKVVKERVVSGKVSQEMIPLLQYVVDNHNIVPRFDQKSYIVGGKTGTAQIAKKGGGYYEDKFNGTYAGFVGGDKVQYVIVVFVDKPTNGGYAGTAAAQPIFASIGHMLINNSYVLPKGGN